LPKPPEGDLGSRVFPGAEKDVEEIPALGTTKARNTVQKKKLKESRGKGKKKKKSTRKTTGGQRGSKERKAVEKNLAKGKCALSWSSNPTRTTNKPKRKRRKRLLWGATHWQLKKRGRRRRATKGTGLSDHEEKLLTTLHMTGCYG